MSNFKINTGEQLVQHGVSRLGPPLPEGGLKAVVPTGSALERRQVEASLLQRKALIGVERIEKSGSLSVAEWNDGGVVEVQEQCGSHWNYLGRHTGEILTLSPEETLLLMELCALRLWHGGVPVSLQKIRSLLSINQYASLVYMSLARVGYRLCTADTHTEDGVDMDVPSSSDEEIADSSENVAQVTVSDAQAEPNNAIELSKYFYMKKIERIKNNGIKKNSKDSADSFNNMALHSAPNRAFIPMELPSSLFASHQPLPRSPSISPANSPPMFTPRSLPRQQFHNLPGPYFEPQNGCFMPLNFVFQRPLYFFNTNVNFFTPRLPPRSRFFVPLYRFPANYGGSITTNIGRDGTYSRKRIHKHNDEEVKSFHLEEIKKLAKRLRLLVASGNPSRHNRKSLDRLIQIYNDRYNCNLSINNNLEVVSVVETIDLEEASGSNKKIKITKDNKEGNENLNSIRQLASKLKDMKERGIVCSRHRKAFSNMLKVYNKTYGVAIYLDDNYDICDNHPVIIDSSSDSDCVLEGEVSQKSKTLPNPFNRLLSENLEVSEELLSVSEIENKIGLKESDTQFHCWQPNDDDFGRPEVIGKYFMKKRLIDTHRELYMCDFLQHRKSSCNNWTDVKLAFWEAVEEKCVINTCTESEEDSIRQRLSAVLHTKDRGTAPTVLYHGYERDVQYFRKSEPPTPHFRVACVEGQDKVQLHVPSMKLPSLLVAVCGASEHVFVHLARVTHHMDSAH